MKNDPSQQAIRAALSSDWETAVVLNKKIIKTNKDDVDAHNRLARAYLELGKITSAKKEISKARSLDPFNPISKRLSQDFLKSPKARGLPKKSDSSALFIEEAGKTKITLLTHTAKANSLSHLTPGDKLMLNPQGWCVSILDPEGKYVGRLDEFVSSKLKTLIKKGNKYEVLLRSINQKCVEVFIKEITKSTSHSNSISFPI